MCILRPVTSKAPLGSSEHVPIGNAKGSSKRPREGREVRLEHVSRPAILWRKSLRENKIHTRIQYPTYSGQPLLHKSAGRITDRGSTWLL